MIKEHLTPDELRTYTKILLLTNVHLEGYQPGGVINVNGGEKFREIIAPLREAQRPWCRFGVTWRLEKNTEMSTSELFYNPARPSAYLTLENLAAAIPKKNNSVLRAWL